MPEGYDHYRQLREDAERLYEEWLARDVVDLTEEEEVADGSARTRVG